MTAVIKAEHGNTGLVTEASYGLTQLVLPADLTYEQWAEIGGSLAVMEKGVNWWVGDWILRGEQSFGDTYTQAINETGRARQTLANLASVAQRVAPERRVPTVAWSLHAEVAGLEPQQQSNLLEQAAEGDWTLKQMKEAVKALKGEIVVEPKASVSAQAQESEGSEGAGEEVEVDEDLHATLRALQEEIEQLRTELDQLRQDDQENVISRLQEELKQQKGLATQARLEAEEHRKDSIRKGNLLEKVRKELGAESDSKILSLLKAALKQADPKDAPQEPVVKRGPGRPRKDAAPAQPVVDNVGVRPVPKGDGRTFRKRSEVAASAAEA